MPADDLSLPSGRPVQVADKRSKGSPIDYSHELTLTKNPLLRALWMVLGSIFTALGMLGIVIRGLPTTIFLILASYFFARSSARFYNWIMNLPTFGPLIRDWKAGLGMPLKAKRIAVTMVLLSTTTSALFFVPMLAGKIALIVTGLGVSLYLITRPTKHEPSAS